MNRLLRLECHHCGTSFVSAHQGVTWHPSVGFDHTEQCPHCGATGRYSPDSYHALGEGGASGDADVVDLRAGRTARRS